MISSTAAPLQREATGCLVPLPLPNSRRTLAGGFALPASFFPAGGHGPQAAADRFAVVQKAVAA